MRKVLFQIMTSLDGFFEGPNQEIDWHVVDEEFNAYAANLLDNVDLLLFGRVTYEGMAGYWPTPAVIANDPIIAGRMNALAKIVFSKTLAKADWNNTRLIKENVAEEIARLKQQPGKDMVILGSSDLAVTFTQLRLIDEYRIIVAPVVLGQGKPLLKGLPGRLNLSLVQTKTFQSDNVLHTYQPA